MRVPGLLTTIQQEVQVPKLPEDSIYAVNRRIVYSALGRTAYASVWSTQDEEDPPTVDTFKKTITSLLPYYRKHIVKKHWRYLEDENALADEILKTYLDAGYLYRSGRSLAPAKPSQCFLPYLNCRLFRGIDPRIQCQMSGLAPYSLIKIENAQEHSCIDEMFGFHPPLAGYASEFLAGATWETIQTFPENTEFLRADGLGYEWQRLGETNNKSNLFSEYGMCRIPSEEDMRYYVINLGMLAQDKIQVYSIPKWMANPMVNGREQPEWVALAAGLLAMNKALPPISVYRGITKHPTLSRISSAFPLPPAEMAFLRLASWPVGTEDTTGSCCRDMDALMCSSLCFSLTALGYQVNITPKINELR